MFFTALFLHTLLAIAAFAFPTSKERHMARVARRRAARGLPPKFVNTTATSTPPPANVTHGVRQYTENWAGAVKTEDPGTWQSVTARFLVGTVYVPVGADPHGWYSVAIWGGIDGWSCQSAILQTGIDITYDDGTIEYNAWYEWYPDYAYDFDISFTHLDTIMATVNATSRTSGTASITHTQTGETVTASLTSNAPLCQQDAEWIIEDYSDDNGIVSFANYGAMWISAWAIDNTGAERHVDQSATVVDIKQNGQVVTYSAVSDTSGVGSQYVLGFQ